MIIRFVSVKSYQTSVSSLKNKFLLLQLHSKNQTELYGNSRGNTAQFCSVPVYGIPANDIPSCRVILAFNFLLQRLNSRRVRRVTATPTVCSNSSAVIGSN